LDSISPSQSKRKVHKRLYWSENHQKELVGMPLVKMSTIWWREGTWRTRV